MKPTDPPSPKATAGQGPPSHKASLRDTAVQGPPPTKESAARYDDGVEHHHPGDHDELHNEDVAHEHSDVNLRAIAMSAVVLVVVVLVSQVLMYLMFVWLEDTAAARDPQPSPLAPPATQMPSTTDSPYFSAGVPGPQLLTNEPMALRKYRAEQQKRLQGSGFDEQTGIAHIPIDQAKRLILQRGLPAREGAAPPTFGVRPPVRGEASGGRTITVEPPGPESIKK